MNTINDYPEKFVLRWARRHARRHSIRRDTLWVSQDWVYENGRLMRLFNLHLSPSTAKEGRRLTGQVLGIIRKTQRSMTAAGLKARLTAFAWIN